MEKKVLVAVDDSIHSRKAVAYAGRIAAVIQEMRFTLVHAQPALSQFLLDEAARSAVSQLELQKIVARNSQAGQAILDRHWEALVRCGVAEKAIELVSLPRHLGVAKDLLDYAQNSLFDAVLIARRGISSLHQMVVGSVSSDLIKNSQVIPVWLVDGEVRSDGVLVAVDGSETSLRAVDHLAFMLSGNPAARVMFFHVMPRLRDFCEIDLHGEKDAGLEAIVSRSDRHCMDGFFAAAMKKLAAAGFGEKQCEFQTAVTLMGVGDSILKAVREGGFGTMVLGRRGMNKAFFSGSVSNYVVQKLSDAALWIIP
jgi:nucleotide-binding universal stress UspA family protein